MNRAKLRERIQNALGEVQGTAGGDNPFALDDLLNEECDELARATYCRHTDVGSEIAAGLADFCAPEIFRITAVTATDAAGELHPLQEVRPQDLDAVTCGRWRDPQRQDTGTPKFYMPSGLNEVQIYPVPDYSSVVAAYSDLAIQTATSQVGSVARPFVATDVGLTLVITGGTGFVTDRYRILSVASGKATLSASAGTAASTGGQATLSQGGLTVYGYACPGETWQGDTDECPLPERAHNTVWQGAALRRIMQTPTADNMARAPMLRGMYDAGRGKLEREAATLSRAQRHRSRPY